MFKRAIAGGLTSLILAGLSPLTALADLPAGTTLITVSSSTQSFDPTVNQVAAINYTVTGPAAASNVFIRIYKTGVTDGSRQCNNEVSNYIATIEGPINRSVGNYSAVWTGRNQSGAVVSPASYCFDLRWGNMPPGVLTPFLEGLITVTQPSAGPGGGGGGAGGGGGGAGPGGGGGAGGAQAGQITASVDPLVINPNATEGNSAYITYTINQTLPNGFTLKVYDSGNFVVKDLYGTSQSVPAGTNATIPWNGRRNNGTIVTAGDYFYKFRVAGADVTTGLIRVEYGVAGAQADIVHYANPSVINPTATPAQIATIYYTVNSRLTSGLTISIKSGNNTVRTLSSTTAPISSGSYQVTWNGRYNNGTVVPIGTYRYAFNVSGQEVGFGTIGVTYGVSPPPSPPVPPAQFVTSHSAQPATFTPALGQTTTVSYTLGKSVTNFKFSIRNVLGAEMVTVTSTNRTAGSYTYLWNGLLGGFSPMPVPAGLYTYVLEAANENPVTGIVTVIALPQTAPVITDLGPDPASFQASGGTTNFRYQINQNARCEFTVWNGIPGAAGNTVVRRLRNGISTFVTNCSTGATVFVPWDGKNDAGAFISASTYYYLIEAVNANGTAQSKTGQVTVTAVPQPTVLDVSSVLANPSAFNPDLGQTTLLTFSLNQAANVTITVTRASDNAFVKTLVSNQFYNAGSNLNSVWNGTDWNGQLVSQGAYNFRVDGTSAQYGNDSMSGSMTVNRGTPPPPPPQALDVSNALANPSSFNPDLGQTTLLTFSLNQGANVTITVTRQSDGSFIKTVASNQFYNAGTNLTVTWNGTDWNNQFVSQGTYNFRVDASSAQYGSDFATSSVTVNRGTTQPPQVTLDVYNASAGPNPFNPESQNTALTFSLNQPANVTVTVTRQSDGSLVKTVVSNQYYNEGTNLTAVWNGTDWNNAFVASGTYNFRVDATSAQYGNDSVTGSVTVNRQSTLQILGGDSATPNPFNPSSGQVTRIDFSTTVTPQTLTVRVYRTTTNIFIRELPVLALSTNSYRAEWNGRDGATNSIVSNDFYTYRIEATYLSQTAQKSGSVTVGSVVGTPPTPPPPGNCGNFTDIAPGHSLCAALEFVKVRGIFRGYDDGSIGLDRVIQRAELLAVIQKAFRYPLDPYSIAADGNLDRSDLTNKTHMWYMPYLKTFKRLGLMIGYPDGKMRPEKTMNTAELYLVFLKAADQAPENIDHYTLQNHVKAPPFKDVPLSHTWYIKYAAFAQLNDLVTTERFYPGRGITRGQVIKLIYDTHLKGLITYGPPL